MLSDMRILTVALTAVVVTPQEQRSGMIAAHSASEAHQTAAVPHNRRTQAAR